MRWLTAHIRPLSAFGSELKGDTLFGQLCWAIRHRVGVEALGGLLRDYTRGQPFLVVADAFPSGYLPRPELPPPVNLEPTMRKIWKTARWRPIAAMQKPVDMAGDGAGDGAAASRQTVWQPALQAHNSINRLTATTGDGFDPFQMARLWPRKGLTLDLHFVIDTDRFPQDLLITCLADIGSFGYGRDASIGLGRFELLGTTDGRPAHAPRPDAFLTLAPCAPQGGKWNRARCFYRPFTRFGRHGDAAATGKQLFKAPILLADAAAVLTPVPMDENQLFVGHGLGGDGRLSHAIPATVHQGYAPAIPIRLPEELA